MGTYCDLGLVDKVNWPGVFEPDGDIVAPTRRYLDLMIAETEIIHHGRAVVLQEDS